MANCEYTSEILNDLDNVCKKPCNFLDIRTGARNFEPRPNTTQIFAYFNSKVLVRLVLYNL